MFTKPNFLSKLLNTESIQGINTQTEQQVSLDSAASVAQEQIQIARKESNNPLLEKNQLSFDIASSKINSIIGGEYKPDRFDAKFLKQFFDKCGVLSTSQKIGLEIMLQSFDGNAIPSPSQKSSFESTLEIITARKSIVLSNRLPSFEK